VIFLKSIAGYFSKLHSFWGTLIEVPVKRKPYVIPAKVEVVLEDVIREVLNCAPLKPATIRMRVRDKGLFVGRKRLLRILRAEGSGMTMDDTGLVSLVGAKKRKKSKVKPKVKTKWFDAVSEKDESFVIDDDMLDGAIT